MPGSDRKRADYLSLTPLQKEAYNFEEVSAVLSGHGYDCVFLTERRDLADFVARHRSSGTVRRVQLTSRCLIARKYENQGLCVAFPVDEDWYFLEHDRLRDLMGEHTTALRSKSWAEGGRYSWPTPSPALLRAIAPYRLD